MPTPTLRTVLPLQIQPSHILRLNLTGGGQAPCGTISMPWRSSGERLAMEPIHGECWPHSAMQTGHGTQPTHPAELLEGFLSWHRGVHNDVHGSLPRHWRAQTHREQLHQLALDFRVQVDHLHVASSVATPRMLKRERGPTSQQGPLLSATSWPESSVTSPMPNTELPGTAKFLPMESE